MELLLLLGAFTFRYRMDYGVRPLSLNRGLKHVIELSCVGVGRVEYQVYISYIVNILISFEGFDEQLSRCRA